MKNSPDTDLMQLPGGVEYSIRDMILKIDKLVACPPLDAFEDLQAELLIAQARRFIVEEEKQRRYESRNGTLPDGYSVSWRRDDEDLTFVLRFDGEVVGRCLKYRSACQEAWAHKETPWENIGEVP